MSHGGPRRRRRGWRIAGAAALALLTTGAGCAARAGGERWQGTVAGGGRPRTLWIEPARDGTRARLSFPAESTWDIPVALGARPSRAEGLWLEGRLDGRRARGRLHVGPRSLALDLARADGAPPPWRSEPMSIGANGRAGTLLLPSTPGRHAGVVLLHGSHGPERERYLPVASLLARLGLAVLMYDKRDVGAPQDAPHRYTLDGLADDADAAVAALARRAEVDPARVGLWGISEGGWVAPHVAARHPVAFVIVVSAPGVSYAALERAMMRYQLAERGAPAAVQDSGVAALDAMQAWVRSGGEPAAWPARLRVAATRPWARTTTLPATPPDTALLRAAFRWHDLDHDPAADWARVHAPVLAMWGDRDPRLVAASTARIGAALAGAGNGDVTRRLFPGADHELTVPAGALPRVAPGVATTLQTWLEAHRLTHAR